MTKDNMNITIIADIYGTSNNGTSVTCNNLARRMKERGHNVTIVSTFEGENESGIKYIQLPKRTFAGLGFIVEKNGVQLAKPDREKIIEGIKDADVVHLLVCFKTSIATIPLLKEYKKPYTSAFHTQPENVTSHFGCMNVKPINKALYKRFKKKFYDKVVFLHAPSQFLVDTLKKYGYKNKFYVISNGVNPKFKRLHDVTKPDNMKDKFVIVNTGRYCKEKRTKLLIDAIAQSKHEKDIQLICLGQGPDAKKLQKRAKKLTNYPVFGYLPFQDFLNSLNYGDLYVHPSNVELEGISCLEAMACGLPCIFSDSENSASRYFAKDERSLFKHDNAKDLAKKIDYLIEHEDERKELANYYQEYSKNFEMNAAMDKMEQMFKDAIEYYKDYYAKN